jgi:hypothetical protein
MSKSIKEYLLQSKVYRVIKAFVQILFPAVVVLDFGLDLAGLVRITVFVIGILGIIALCLGVMLYIATKGLDDGLVGEIVIIENDRGGKMYSLDFGDRDPEEEIETRQQVLFKIRR